MIPDLVARTKIPLERANAASDGIRRVSGFFGAPLAGVLIAFTGTSNLLWLDGLSFICSALLVGLLVMKIPAVSQSTGARQYVADLLEGLRFIRQTPLILAIVLTVMITNMLDEAHFAVIYPDYVRHFFGSAIVLGVLIAAFGGAAFAGTVIFGTIGHRLPRRLTFGVCFIVIGLRFWIMALIPPLALLLVTNIICGLAAGPLNPIMYTVEQERVPQQMRARVFGSMTAGAYLATPLGAFVGGYLVQGIGIQAALIALGACYAVTTVSLLVNPALRNMEKPETLPA